ncbi:hypothetical protein Q31b_57140 [Novipirellula aureliae]|uniref:Secreted protein n=1 Tax=Novipirellula aureliae TaxID=2527966 RepID=A0A5C6DD09_9BACT|nr:hypothetical protein [Novipirellula aureliae]TWU33657.1 hypothetical protein Q31b_57140 [Novipirellula aureliae]
MYLTTIRIAVTACLIVSTTIQPMASLAMPVNCVDKGCDQTQKCPGCGCCELQSVDDRCCCCTAEAQLTEEDEQPTEKNVDVTMAAGSKPAVSHCSCGVSTPPMDRTNPREQIVRELAVRLSMLDFVVLDEMPLAVDRLQAIDDSFGSRADFSQRFLCVWRI